MGSRARSLPPFSWVKDALVRSRDPAEPWGWDTELGRLRYLRRLGLRAGLWLLLSAAWRVDSGCVSDMCCWDRRLPWLSTKNAPEGLVGVAFLSAQLSS